MLGFPHPDYLLETISYRQFAEWEAFYEKSPFGEDRKDMRTYALWSAVIAPWMKDKEDKTVPSPFFPYGLDNLVRDLELEFQTLQEVDEQLIPDGRGGYRWHNSLN